MFVFPRSHPKALLWVLLGACRIPFSLLLSNSIITVPILSLTILGLLCTVCLYLCAVTLLSWPLKTFHDVGLHAVCRHIHSQLFISFFQKLLNFVSMGWPMPSFPVFLQHPQDPSLHLLHCTSGSFFLFRGLAGSAGFVCACQDQFSCFP